MIGFTRRRLLAASAAFAGMGAIRARSAAPAFRVGYQK